MDSVLVASTQPLPLPGGGATTPLRPLIGVDRPGFEQDGSRVYVVDDQFVTWRDEMQLDAGGRAALAAGLELLRDTTPEHSCEVMFSGSLAALHSLLSTWLFKALVVV